MGFYINTNINALNAERNLMATSTAQSTTFQRLSSGLRINSAADDAAGLAIGQKLNAQVNGLNQAVQNAQDGISLVQTAEGALQQTQSILQRMRQLAVQSSNDTNTQTDRVAIQSEINQLASELSRISNTTTFNTKNLLAGGFAGQTLQIGANAGENMSFSISAMDASTLGVAGNGASVSATKNNANIQSLSAVGSGYTNGVNYTVNSTQLAAGSLANAVGVNSTGSSQGTNIGTETLSSASTGSVSGASTIASAVTGDTLNVTTAINARVTGLSADGKQITQIQAQVGSSTAWTTINGVQQSNGTYQFSIGGVTFNDATHAGTTTGTLLTSFTNGAVGPQIGDQFTLATSNTTTSNTFASNVLTGAAFTFTSVANTTGTTAVTAGQNTGNEQLNVAGAFVGTSSTPTNYLIKVTGISSNNPNQINQIQYSTDGGNSWANGTATLLANGTYSFKVNQASTGAGSSTDSGLTLNFPAPTNMVAPAIGDIFGFQATSGTNSTGAAGTSTNIGLQGVKDTTTPADTSSFSVSGTYTGSLAGAISLNVASALTTAAGITTTTVTGVKIGGVTLDSSQYVINNTAKTLTVMGLTLSVSAAATGIGAAGTGYYAVTSNLTPATQGQSAALSGTAATSFGTTSGATAAVTMGGSATYEAASQSAMTGGLSSGQSLVGLGSGSVLLQLSQASSGASVYLDLGYNGLGTQTAPSNTNSVQLSTSSNTLTNGNITGNAAIQVTGVDGKTYNIVLANVNVNSSTNAATAQVSIYDNAAGGTTFSAGDNVLSTYTVSLSNMTTGAASAATNKDTMGINLSPTMVTPNNVTASTNLGAEQAAVSGTYTGTSNQQYQIKVATVDTYGNVTGVQVSTNGGQTYGSTINANTTPGSAYTQTTFNIGNGLTFTADPAQANQNQAAVGDLFNFVATASSANGGTGTNLLQLQYTDSTNVSHNLGGSAMLVNGQTSALLGAGTMTMNANFGAYGSAGSVGSGATTITSQGSAAAVMGSNDTIVTNAVAYAGLDVTSQANAQKAITTIDTAINTVSLQRAALGAIQNRLQDTISNLQVGSQNLAAAQSRIMNVDVAAETVNMTKNSILMQAGISVLAQANQMPQMVLKLLQ